MIYDCAVIIVYCYIQGKRQGSRSHIRRTNFMYIIQPSLRLQIMKEICL